MRPPVGCASPSGVLVVGAGPTGLTLALELARAGVPCRVVDAHAAPSPLSRAVVVQARTLELLDRHGLAEPLRAEGYAVDAANLYVHRRRAARIEFSGAGLGLTPYPFPLVVSQDVTERVLREAFERAGGRVEWGTRLVGFEQDADGVSARLERDGDEETTRATYLVGADGAGSAVREGLGVGFEGATYEGHFFVADAAVEGLVEGELQVRLGARTFHLFFPMRGAQRFRIIGLLPGGVGAEPEWEEVKAAIEAAEHVRIRDVAWFSAYRVHHRLAERFRVGRVFLAGDAAHVHSPVGGQGMNTGMGDAVNLGWKLAAVASGRGPARLLDTYEAERMPFARQLVRTVDQAFVAVSSPSAWARFVRLRLVPRVAPALLGVGAVRRLAFRNVGQLALGYTDGPLAEGRAGRVRGGERPAWMPGLEAAFRTPGWTLLVVGPVSDDARRWAEARRIGLHTVDLSGAVRRAGYAEGAVLLLRPDAYVGLAAPAFDAARFSAYAGAWGAGDTSGRGAGE